MAGVTKKTYAYLGWSFGIAWVLQVVASILAKSGNQMGFSLTLSCSMYAPLIAVLLSRNTIRDMGWKPKFKGNWGSIFLAWFLPGVLSILGAVVYFIVFPNRFDLSGAYIVATLGENAMTQLEAQGMTYPVYLIISVISSMLYAPWINMFFALGEEVGWRGCLYPQLKEKFGNTKGRIIGGIIWGAWHWPIMILAGYEYGSEYWGAPVLGMVVFCLYTTVAGILIDEVYERTNCIWVPSLAHGAVNASTISILVLNPLYSNQLILGPMPIGLISMIPVVVLAVLVVWKKK